MREPILATWAAGVREVFCCMTGCVAVNCRATLLQSWNLTPFEAVFFFFFCHLFVCSSVWTGYVVAYICCCHGDFYIMAYSVYILCFCILCISSLVILLNAFEARFSHVQVTSGHSALLHGVHIKAYS